MLKAVEGVLTVLLAVGIYGGVPALMLCGWARWFTRTQSRTVPVILSLIGLALAGGVRPAWTQGGAFCRWYTPPPLQFDGVIRIEGILLHPQKAPARSLRSGVRAIERASVRGRAYRRGFGGFFLRISLAASFARPRIMPELLTMASGHSVLAAR